jgi:hypothetical protein
MIKQFLCLATLAHLQGGVFVNVGEPKLIKLQPHFDTHTSKPKQTIKQKIFVVMKISAIGMTFDSMTGEIRYIDSKSYLYKRVNVGDILLSIDGKDPDAWTHNLNMFGQEGTIVKIQYIDRRTEVVKTILCKRVSLDKFAPNLSIGLKKMLRP